MLLPIHTSPVAPFNPQTLFQSFAEPTGKMYLTYGDRLVFRLSLVLAAQVLSKGGSIAVIDGGNRFDVHTITNFARERRLDPDALLNRIFVSRGFTCYQMEAAITSRLPEFLARNNSRVAMIFGLLDTFYDEQAPLREVRQILNRVLHALYAMKNDNISVLLASTEYNVLPKERNQLFVQLRSAMDTVYHLTLDTDNKPQLSLEDHQTALQQKGAITNGTHSADLHQHHRQRDSELVKIPPRTPQRRPGVLR
ncbi:MAG: hypothetical protein HY276_10685 [Ignavibacteriales bacterium]|nr:hypothetical protein [Ignavibacteriales bacterium]